MTTDAREELRASVQPVMEKAETYAKWWSTAPYPKDKAAIESAAMQVVARARAEALRGYRRRTGTSELLDAEIAAAEALVAELECKHGFVVSDAEGTRCGDCGQPLPELGNQSEPQEKGEQR